MRQRKPRASANQRWLSLTGRLALIVSLWHAPLPVLHAHGADVVDSTLASRFVEHLVEYHAAVPMNSHIDFGWHWHLVPPPVSHPGDDPSDGRCPFSPHDSQQSLLQAQQSATVLQTVCVWAVIAWQSHCPTAADLSMQVAPAAPTRFLDTYLGSVPLGTLLRVARC